MLKRIFSRRRKTGNSDKIKRRMAGIVGVLALGILLSINIFTTYAGTAPSSPIGTDGYFDLEIRDVTNPSETVTARYRIYLNPYHDDGSAVWSNAPYKTKVTQQLVSGQATNVFDFSVTAGDAIQDGWAAVNPGVYDGTRYYVIPINIDVRSANGNSSIFIKDEVGFKDTTTENGSDYNTFKPNHEVGSAHLYLEMDTNNCGLTHLHAGGEDTHCIITLKIDRSDRTLTAHPNGGEFSDNSSKKNRNYKVTVGQQTNNSIATAKQSGKKFTGWYTAGGQKVYNADGSFYNNSSNPYWNSEGRWKIEGDGEVYAQYEDNRGNNNLRANPNGGKFTDTHSSSARDFTVKYGEQTNCSIPTASKSGAEIEGWYTSDGRKVFNADGTFYNNSSNPYWNSEGRWKIEGDGEVTAKYKNVETVKYTFSETHDSGIDSVSGAGKYEKGKQAKARISVKTGYRFKEASGTNADGNGTSTWSTLDGTDSDDVPYMLFTMNADRAINFSSQPNTYTIIYDGNGSTGGSTPDTSCTYDQDAVIANNGFTRTGYTFSGWSTKANAGWGSTSYSQGQKVKNLTSKNKGKVKLYAQWTPNKYNITYHANDNNLDKAKNIPNKQEYTYGEDSVTLSNNRPSRPGYTFMGWSKKSDSERASYASGSELKKEANNIDLYAIWQINYYDQTNNFYKEKNGTWVRFGNSVTHSVKYRTYFKNTTTGFKGDTTGYHFWKFATDGWTVMGDKNDKDGYGYYSPNQYTVKYNSNGATSGVMKDGAQSSGKYVNKLKYDVSYQLTTNLWRWICIIYLCV